MARGHDAAPVHNTDFPAPKRMNIPIGQHPQGKILPRAARIMPRRSNSAKPHTPESSTLQQTVEATSRLNVSPKLEQSERVATSSFTDQAKPDNVQSEPAVPHKVPERPMHPLHSIPQQASTNRKSKTFQRKPNQPPNNTTSQNTTSSCSSGSWQPQELPQQEAQDSFHLGVRVAKTTEFIQNPQTGRIEKREFQYQQHSGCRSYVYEVSKTLHTVAMKRWDDLLPLLQQVQDRSQPHRAFVGGNDTAFEWSVLESAEREA